MCVVSVSGMCVCVWCVHSVYGVCVCMYMVCVHMVWMCGYVGECGWCVGLESERDLESRESHVRGVGLHSEQFLIASTISY